MFYNLQLWWHCHLQWQWLHWASPFCQKTTGRIPTSSGCRERCFWRSLWDAGQYTWPLGSSPSCAWLGAVLSARSGRRWWRGRQPGHRRLSRRRCRLLAQPCQAGQRKLLRQLWPCQIRLRMHWQMQSYCWACQLLVRQRRRWLPCTCNINWILYE